MFEASHSFSFFDYFRVPYEVRPYQQRKSLVGAPAFVRVLTTAAQPGMAPRSLLWVGADHRPAAAALAGRLGRYRLHDFTFFGHVVPDDVAQAMLREPGRDWRAAEPIYDERNSRVAAVWRDTDGNVFLPFDPGEAMQLFWSEGYRVVGRSAVAALVRSAALRCYYLVRSAIPRPVQIALRRKYTRVQERADFPKWPIEDCLHDFYDWLFAVISGVAGGPVPFLSPWPMGRSWALVLTHDVETGVGYQDMNLLREPERARGYRSSWNFAGARYQVDQVTVRSLHDEGCEVGVHGLWHDGRDLDSELIDERLPAMWENASRWNAVGFRSPATHRGWELMHRLGFRYDSSFTDTDPYEPQPGGCCTTLPFFNHGTVELPITLAQDHTVFAILQHPDAELWLRKARHIRDNGGMALVLTHPDYARDQRVADGYRQLLDAFAGDGTVWHALPSEVADWWCRRVASTIRADGGGWRIDGPASDDGRICFAGPDDPMADQTRPDSLATAIGLSTDEVTLDGVSSRQSGSSVEV